MTEKLFELPNGAVLETHFRDWSSQATTAADLISALLAASHETRLTILEALPEWAEVHGHAELDDMQERAEAAERRAEEAERRLAAVAPFARQHGFANLLEPTSPTVAASEPAAPPAEVTHEQARNSIGSYAYQNPPAHARLVQYIAQQEARDRRIAELEAGLTKAYSERDTAETNFARKCREFAELELELASAMSHRNQLQADIEAEWQGRKTLRDRFGAREDDTMPSFIERLATERDALKAKVAELEHTNTVEVASRRELQRLLGNERSLGVNGPDFDTRVRAIIAEVAESCANNNCLRALSEAAKEAKGG